MKKVLFVLLSLVQLIASALLHSDVRQFRNSKLLINEDNVIFNTPEDDISFFAIGDWGGVPVFPFKTLIEQSTSSIMTSLAKLHNTKFQIALGDNFYFDGVKDVEDRRFFETFESVFSSDYLKTTPWFVILGNHDHYGNATAQVDYMKESNRWILPSLNYSIDVLTKGGDTHLISILMLDTVQLCGNTPHDGDEFSSPKFHTEKDEYMSEFYFVEIENQLRKIASTYVPYIIVTGHFPVWSIAEHGPTDCLVEKLRPMLHKYKVSAYLNGHDHNLQHISDHYLNQTVEYIVSGAADFVSDSTAHITNIPPGSLKFNWPSQKNHLFFDGGFTLLKANDQNMTVSFMQSNGVELHQVVIQPRSFN